MSVLWESLLWGLCGIEGCREARAARGQLTRELGTGIFSQLHKVTFCWEDVPLSRQPLWVVLGVPLFAGRRDHIPECCSEAAREYIIDNGVDS